MTNKSYSDTSIAIVVLNYNGKKLLETYLDSLKDSSSQYNYNLVVLDNGSTDDSVEYLRKFHPMVKTITLESNFGFAGGYNHGLRMLEYEYVALVNSDIRATKNWLDPIIELLDKDKSIGCIQPKIRADRQPDYFEYAGASGGFYDWLGYPFCRGRLFEHIEADKGQYDTDIEIGWASGAAFVIRKEIFTSLGGFDERYFAHQEEIDLCWRVRKAGYKCMIKSNSVVYHLGGATLSYANPRKTFLNFRNNLLSITKNFSPNALIYVIPLRLMLDGIAGIKFLLGGEVKNTWAVIKAHFSYYSLIPYILRKRKELNSALKTFKIGPKRSKGKVGFSILFQVFAKGITKYSDLPKD